MGATEVVRLDRLEWSPALTPKVRRMRLLGQLGLPLPPTWVVPGLQRGGAVRAAQLGPFAQFYARLAHHSPVAPARVGGVVDAADLEMCTRRIADCGWNGDLIVQPLQRPRFAGALLRRGDLLLVEAVAGASAALLTDGRIAQRAILTGGALVHVEAENPGGDGFRLSDAVGDIVDVTRRIDDAIVEWAGCGGDIVVFDYRPLARDVALPGFVDGQPRAPTAIAPPGTDLPGLRAKAPQVDRPSLDHLAAARRSGGLVVRDGARLAHLVTYGVELGYACLFEELAQ